MRRTQRKGPLQLDLFEPVEENYEYEAIITNKTNTAAHVVKFHEGRGSQEKIFGEAKSQAQMDYIPAKRRAANEAFLLASILTHNLTRAFRICKCPRWRTPASLESSAAIVADSSENRPSFRRVRISGSGLAHAVEALRLSTRRAIDKNRALLRAGHHSFRGIHRGPVDQILRRFDHED